MLSETTCKPQRQSTPPGDTLNLVPIDEWLDDLENERDSLIMRLRQVDRALVRHRRLRRETLIRRGR